MTPITHTLSTRGEPKATPPDRKDLTNFSNPYEVAEATALLRPTAQYEKWKTLCQKDDGLASDLAEMLLERHNLLKKIQQDQGTDWSRFDHLTQTLAQNNIHLYKSRDIIKSLPVTNQAFPPPVISPLNAPLVIQLTPGSASQPAISLPELANALPTIANPSKVPMPLAMDNLVILNVKYKNFQLSESLIGYGDANKVFLPLGETAELIDFEIRVDDDTGTADGWFISEDRNFSLNLSKGKVVVDKKDMAIPEGSTVVGHGDIFVDSRVFGQWFPVNFKYDFSQQQLQVEPREKLPLQSRIEREENWRGVSTATGDGTVFPRLTTGYNLLEGPMGDLNLVGTFEDKKKEGDQFDLKYNLLAKGDVGKMTGELYLSGTAQKGLDNSRITFERGDPEGKLLGPLKATQFSIGDVQIPSFPLISGAQNETGFSLGNEALNQTRDFDTTRFEGTISPGWDVELYQNGTLVDSVRVGSDGRYDFDEVPVYYGKNDFELIFYGPQGQKRVETKTMDVGSQMLKKGKGEYRLSMTGKNSRLIDLGPGYQPQDSDSLRVVGKYEYGLNEKVSLGSGILSQELDGLNHTYLNVGIKNNLGNAFISSDFVQDTQGGNAVEGLIQTRLSSVDLTLKQELYNNFVDEGTSKTDPMTSRTRFSLAGRTGGTESLPDIPYSLSYIRTQKEFSTENSLSANLAAGIGSFYFNNSLDWRKDSGQPSSELSGFFQANGQFGDLRLRSRLNYGLTPKVNIESAEAAALFNPGDDLNSELFVKVDLENDNQLEGAFRLNWDTGRFTLSPQVSYNSDNEFKALIGLTTSFGMRPRTGQPYLSSAKTANSGAVSARVFLDANSNSIFDSGDTPVQGAAVSAVQGHKEAITDENGLALVTGLKSYKPTDVVVKPETLEDPFWEPTTKGNSIVPRPGHTEIMEIPIITTGEIDGTVAMATDGTQAHLANVRLQLLDKDGEVVQNTRSEYDGFYIFMKVPPGDYTVRVHPKSAERLGVPMVTDAGINIANDGTVASGRDLLLGSPTGETAQGLPQKMAAAPIAEQGKGISPKNTVRKAAPSTDISFVPVPAAENSMKKGTSSPADTKYGVHLTSYRTRENAVKGMALLRNRYKSIKGNLDFTVQKVDLGPEKGVWHRVIAGAVDSPDAAHKLERKIRKTAPYCKVISLDNTSRSGVHMASYRTKAKAAMGIQELKSQYPGQLGKTDFSIRSIDLGPGKGTWKRVIAGNFTSRDQADALAERLKNKHLYTRVMPVENKGVYSLHISSYRDREKAAQGLKELQDKFGAMLKDQPLSIKRTDLGTDKGVWFRVMAGQFDEKSPAKALKKSLVKMGQYAKILDFSF